ncbi:MAG: DUF2391 family protein [Candidatus Buchananbacteria bacterium]|nr:DUF2391 family protein [Candidatus Buchananbacteria bacterium]
MENNHKVKREKVRVGRYLNEIVTITDSAGNLLHKISKPLMIEFYFRDVIQVIVGATLLAMPIMFTEEVWRLSEILPVINILAIGLVSLIFVGSFVYYNYYRDHSNFELVEFVKRVVATYIVSAIVVGLLLFLIDKAPLGVDWVVTLKRIVIISLPASMSAAIADVLK